MNKQEVRAHQNTRYKDKYLICFYDEDDILRRCYLNIYEMAYDLNLSISDARNRISRLKSKKFKTIKIKGERMYLKLIEDENPKGGNKDD